MARRGAGAHHRVEAHRDVEEHQDAGELHRAGASGAVVGLAGAWAPPAGSDRGSGLVAEGDVAVAQGAASAPEGAIAAGLALAWPGVESPAWPSPQAWVWGPD